MSSIQDAGVAGFFGVTKDRTSWKAQVVVEGKIINLGRFHTADAAAYAYDRAALAHGIERLNNVELPVFTSLLDAKQVLGESLVLSIINDFYHKDRK